VEFNSAAWAFSLANIAILLGASVSLEPRAEKQRPRTFDYEVGQSARRSARVHVSRHQRSPADASCLAARPETGISVINDG